jgi:hypothetical protein
MPALASAGQVQGYAAGAARAQDLGHRRHRRPESHEAADDQAAVPARRHSTGRPR